MKQLVNNQRYIMLKLIIVTLYNYCVENTSD